MSSPHLDDAAAEVDHRSLAQRLDLLHFQDEAPGMVFWHPRGMTLYRLLEEAARRQARAEGYAEVKTPQILRRPIWEQSGHWRHFADGMFRVDIHPDGVGGGGPGALEAAIKPVSCPGHVQLVARRPPSYRELPLRLSELGLCHRDEPSGTLHGLLRLRQFTQDDGHIFCAEADVQAEVLRFCRKIPAFYRAFGFDDVQVALSLRPAERAGEDALWDRAEAALEGALRALGQPFAIQPGAGAFYGPKVEYALPDAQGRPWQVGTIQLDLVMPGRFDLRYMAADGSRPHPAMLHRAIYGSLERFLGLLLERHRGALPGWLAPVQVAVLPVGPEQASAAAALAGKLAQAGLRAVVEAGESLGKRIALAHAQGIPHQVIIGAREALAGSATIRAAGEQRTLAGPAAIEALAALCAWPAFGEEEGDGGGDGDGDGDGEREGGG
jgi:threonyl-tRNA synthetase